MLGKRHSTIEILSMVIILSPVNIHNESIRVLNIVVLGLSRFVQLLIKAFLNGIFFKRGNKQSKHWQLLN